MVCILLGTGFEEVEAITPCDILRRGGVDVRFVGVDGKQVTGAHGITVSCDLTIDALPREQLEMIVLPGGLGGVDAVGKCRAATDALRNAWEDGKFVCAICAGPTLLAKLGITDGKKATCYPGCEKKMGSAKMTGEPAVRDGKLICGQAPGAAAAFGFMLLAALKGEAAAESVRKGMVYTDARV